LTPAVDLRDVRFGYDRQADILDIETFRLAAGEHLFLRGPSGSGKSTLLGLIAGVLRPQRGVIDVLGIDMANAPEAARDRMRARQIGVIFQMFNLVAYLNVIENVLLPLQFSPDRRGAVEGTPEAEARRLLARLGMADEALLRRRVSDLSVGQQQRVAAARALIGAPKLVIADEPTSALDSEARDLFIALLSDETRRAGASLLFVSHDAALAPLFDRAVDLSAINRARATV
jgi:putative ABC transport system ATP-binding protein